MSTRIPKILNRKYATHLPTKTPLIFPNSPPTPPHPTTTTPSSNNSTTLPKPRLNYINLLSNLTKTTQNHLHRNSPISPQHLSHLTRLRETQLILLSKLSKIKSKQREIGQLIRSNLGDTDEALRQAKKLKIRVGEYEKTLTDVETELLELGLALPNFSHPDSPIGPEENAVVLDTFGPKPLEVDGRRDHLDIANYYEWLDNDASTIAVGSSWPYLKGTLALLELSLINYSISIAIKQGFQPVTTPDVVKIDLATRCGFQPRDSPDGPTQTYLLENPNANSTLPNQPTHCLAGTAEIPLSALFANKIIPYSNLPKKVVGVGKAYRAEAGARGTDTRGLYRVHQFTKVELFAVTDQYGSEEMMEIIRGVQKEVAEGLGLSARVLDMPTEELGASAARKYDMEAWMPGRGKWGEITSTSNCTDYQARRLHIRYRPPPSSTPSSPSNSSEPLPFAHTLNGTAAAIPRLLVALIENGVRFSSTSVGDSGDKGIEGLDLPKALERFWIGGEYVGEGDKRGLIRWV